MMIPCKLAVDEVGDVDLAVENYDDWGDDADNDNDNNADDGGDD